MALRKLAAGGALTAAAALGAGGLYARSDEGRGRGALGAGCRVPTPSPAKCILERQIALAKTPLERRTPSHAAARRRWTRRRRRRRGAARRPLFVRDVVALRDQALFGSPHLDSSALDWVSWEFPSLLCCSYYNVRRGPE